MQPKLTIVVSNIYNKYKKGNNFMKKYLGLTIILILIVLLIITIFAKKEKTYTSNNLIQVDNNISIDYAIEISNELQSSKIKEYLPENIEEIIINNYLTTNPEPITKNYTDKEQIYKFIKLTNNTYWTEEQENDRTDNRETKDIVIKGNNSETILKLYAVSDTEGYVGIEKESNEKIYRISKIIFQEISSFNEEKFYLHKSELETPSEDKCIEAQKKVFEGLTDKEIKEVKEKITNAHTTLEYLLLDAVRLLKEPTSPYWNIYITGEAMADFSSGEIFSFGETYCFNYTLTTVQEAMKLIKNDTALNDLEEYCNKMTEGINNHDLSKCFEAHEILHDYDVWIIAYPKEDLKVAPPDWNGLKTYFGKTSMFE